MSKATYQNALSSGNRVDRDAGIIRGVSVFQAGEISDRGLHADRKTLLLLKQQCDAYTNGVKVKADHKSGIFAVSGILRGFRMDGDVLRADLHVLSSEENREKLMEMAEEIPDTFGLSVSIEQELEQVGDKMMIRPTQVFSVDLVTEPAACPNGLFEKTRRMVDATTQHKKMNPEEIQKEFSALKDALKSFEQRLAKFEQVEPPMRKEMSEKVNAFEVELKAVREEFSKKLETQTGEIITKVAAEFSKVLGTTVVKAEFTDTTRKNESDKPKLEDAFEKKVQAEFAKNGGQKQKAMSAAIAADRLETGGKGYEAFIATGKSVHYSKSS